jgi:hypothetical protein
MRLRNLLHILLLAVSVTASSLDNGSEDDALANARAEETIRKTFPLTAADPRALEIDNVYGSIEVVGTAAEQIQLVANKIIRADSQAELQRAQKEVTLDIAQEGNRVRLYVNGPFRCRNVGGDCCRCEERRYVVQYDFKLEVPQRINLQLKTVNHGSVKVRRVRGDYSIRNVNGPIDMEEVAGSGHARTVNGRVRVTFADNPSSNSEFATINGNVDLYFAPRLAADFRFKTMNGNIYSDFPLSAGSRSPGKSERRGGRFVFSADRYTAGRVGTGGPEIKLENLNGDLRVLSRAN